VPACNRIRSSGHDLSVALAIGEGVSFGRVWFISVVA
jgi:hypothetical protein